MEDKWYKHPQGIVSAIAIVTTILGFFYIREKQMWEQSAAIRANEQRGAVAIAAFRGEVDAIRDKIAIMERAIWELEHQAQKYEKGAEP